MVWVLFGGHPYFMKTEAVVGISIVAQSNSSRCRVSRKLGFVIGSQNEGLGFFKISMGSDRQFQVARSKMADLSHIA